MLDRAVNGGDPEAVRTAFSRLEAVITVHLKLEDDVLYPRLRRMHDPRITEMARRYQDEMGGLHARFTALAGVWLADGALRDDLPGFAAAWSSLRAALADRIARENTELYAVLDEAFGRNASPNSE